MRKGRIICYTDNWEAFRGTFDTLEEIEERFEVKIIDVKPVDNSQVIIYLECENEEFQDLIQLIGGSAIWRKEN